MTITDVRRRLKLDGDEVILLAKELGLWPLDADREIGALKTGLFRLAAVLSGLHVLSPATRAVAMGVMLRRLPEAAFRNAEPHLLELRLADREYMSDSPGFVHLPTGLGVHELPAAPIAKEVYSLAEVLDRARGEMS